MLSENKTKKELLSELQKLNQPEKEFLDALILGKYSLSSELVHTYLAEPNTIIELYEKIIKKSLYKVGELWEYNKISVATEHQASAIVESLMNQLYFDIISTKKKNKTVIAGCVENEFHQIGIKMISDVFEMNGWDALFLGSNTPTSELISFMKIKNPDLLAISLSLYFNLPILEKLIQQVRREFSNLPILVGGQGFNHGGQDITLKYDKVTFCPDLISTQLFIKNL